jgi:hypothetical protein
MIVQPSLRLLPSTRPSLGHFLRVGRSDHRNLLEVLAEGRLSVSGLVFDAALVTRHAQLMQEADHAGIPRILDPRSFELATDGGYARAGVSDLPWAGSGSRPQTPADFDRTGCINFVEALADFAVQRGFDTVLAPSHYVEDHGSPWLGVDIELTKRLRERMDSIGGEAVAIHYPLGFPAVLLRDRERRAVLETRMRGLPIDALWLRIHPFAASTVGPIVLRGYIEGARAFHGLGIPLVGEHTGGAGLSLLAFGAIGGIEGGVTRGERFDVSDLMHRMDGDPWSPAPRVYIDSLGLYLTRNQARELAARKGAKAALACKDLGCCPRGFDDMIRQPVRHFLIQRQREVERLADVPSHLRAKHYVEEFLRPTLDRALHATRLDPGLTQAHQRLDSRRRALEAMLTQLPAGATVALAPQPGRLSPSTYRPHSI